MTHAPARYSNTLIFPASLDPDAVTVVNRLNEAGLESYFVGGCVRDLLLGLIPKDFDISTAARPRQIRRLFRNSRIIGRRFKLAHVHFGQNIIEVATFRRTPEGSGEPGVTPGGDAAGGRAEGAGAGADEGAGGGEDRGGSGGDGGDEHEGPGELPDLLITRDNEFGTAEQDAVRRDFTINALLYDVRTGEVIDYVGGVQDLNDRVLRTIGDPMVRFAEDPVRMLRAVKFMSRLGLHPAPDVEAALHASAESIELSAPPRVLEEIYKLMGCGHAGPGLTRLLDYGLLQRLLPEVSGYWSAHRDELTATGEALDRIDRGRRAVSNAFLLAALCLQPWRAALAERPEADPLLRAHELFDDAALRMSIPRRDITGMRQLLLTQLRLDGRRRGRRFRMRDFLSRPSTEEGLQLLHLAARAGYADPEIHAEWMQRIAEAAPEDRPVPGARGAGEDEGDGGTGEGRGEHAAQGGAEREPGRRRRRRRGGRRHRGRHGEGRGPGAAPGGPRTDGLDETGQRRAADAAAHDGAAGGFDGSPGAESNADGSPETNTQGDGAEQAAGGAMGAAGRRRRRRGGRGRRGRHRREPGADPTGGSPGEASAPYGGDESEANGDRHEVGSDVDSGLASTHASQAEGAPRGEDEAAHGNGNGGRRRRRRGGRRHRGRHRDRPANEESRVAESAAEPRDASMADAPTPANERTGDRGGERSGGRGDRSGRESGRRRRARRGGGGQPREARPPREARETRESNVSGADESLSPARPSKAKEPAPGSRLRDNPESVEDLFDW